MPSHNLAHIEIDDLEIIGYSVAGEETVVAVPQLDVCFDIGKAPDQAISINHVLLTHGHMDHAGSLYAVLNEIGKPIPLVLHPDVFSGPRYFGLEDGTKLQFPQIIAEHELSKRKIPVLESEHPLLIADDMIMVTGEVEHTTDFEKGLPNALVERNGELVHDPIADDQALVMKLKEKGLVIISGCAHAGIVNTVYHAQKVTGEQEVYSIMGGFHLTGSLFEPIIGNTVEALKDINPEVLVPMHCTGWKAIDSFSEAFPEAFILNSVGSKYALS